MDPINIAALVVASVAFIIALLQVIQQYVSSAPARIKVNRAAIGKWSTMNRYRWSFRYWQLQIEYAQPTMKADSMVKCIQHLEKSILREVVTSFPPPLRQQYTFGMSFGSGVGAQGERLVKAPTVVILDKGEPVKLSWRMRSMVENAQKRLLALNQGSSAHVKATWYNMMSDIVIDPLLPLNLNKVHETTLQALRRTADEKISAQLRERVEALMEHPEDRTYADAETVASNLDNPLLYVHASDLIQCALLLDMDPAGVSIEKNRYDMRGQFCSLSSQDTARSMNQPIVSYFSKPGHRHQLRNCNRYEAANLVKLSKGILCIGDSFASVGSWGYNGIEMLFSAASAKADGNRWQEIALKTEMIDVEDDTNQTWNGKWLTPLTPSFPFLMGLCAASAVANAFPRRLLTDRWTAKQREVSSRKAYQLLEATTGFLTSPQDLFSKILEDGRDLVVVEGYKVCNNWGPEYGGLRGWLTTNLAEFTYRISQCWKVDRSNNHQVPILSNLKNALRDGSLNRDWGTNYTQKRAEVNSQKGVSSDRGKLWRMQVGTLLFLQTMLFDTWLASHCEMIMNDGECSEYVAPTLVSQAEQARSRPENNVLEVTGWKKCRLDFTLHYLRRLANGRNGRSPSCMGVDDTPDASGAPLTVDVAVQEERWQDMPIGEARQWMTFDAVFTLRAVTTATRLELLKDSSVLLDLEEFDPLVRMM
ncbi:hypothetical protein VNI00_010098 [Paramarasmius palmivorus]|uniref:Uncharacterized protein n=1 Tax=Paramarasmius palmivorus TaxID=297713 RepID=A0AAW0CJ73_9AGAR